MPPKTKADVISLFQRAQDADVADEVAVGWPLLPERGADQEAPAPAIDLSNRPKVLMTIGPGNVGKSTLLRWIVETILRRESQAIIAAVDPGKRSLKDYFAGVAEPPSYVPAAVVKWLEDLLRFVMSNKASAAIDFGGGDSSLGQLIATTPDLTSIMEDAGVSPVALYVMSPRVDDLSPLAALEKAGFAPKATAIILNEGTGDPTKPREQSFGPILRHSVFKSALDRGAVQLWMPRLIPAAEVELRRIQFAQARDGIAPEGRKVTPLNAFDRSRVRHWLDAMTANFQPIASWLP